MKKFHVCKTVEAESIADALEKEKTITPESIELETPGDGRTHAVGFNTIGPE